MSRAPWVLAVVYLVVTVVAAVFGRILERIARLRPRDPVPC
jgi:hypothetical protein